MSPPSRGLSSWTIGLLLLATLALAWERAGLEIDPENRALRSIDTVDARRMAARRAAFGEDRVVIAAVLPQAGPDGRADPAATLDDLAAAWRALPAVQLVAVQPVDGGDLAVAVVVMRPGVGQSARELLAALRGSAAPRVPPDERLVLTGLPAAEVAVAAAVGAEQRRTVPIAGLVLFALLLLAYRDLRLAAAAFSPALAGVFWTGGLFRLLGHRLDPIASLLEPVVLTVGVAGAVHLVEAFRLERGRGRGGREAAEKAIREIAWPALLTTATTVAGFLALATHPIPAVRGFGLFAALGAGLTVALTFLITPEILARGRTTDRMTMPAPGSGAVPRTIATALARASPGLVIGALLLTTLAGVAWTRLTVDTDPVAVLPRDHPFRVDFESLSERLGGLETFDVMIGRDSPATHPGALLLLERHLLDLPLVVELAEAIRHSPAGDLLVTGILRRSGSGERKALFDRLDERFRRVGYDGAFCTGSAVQIARDSTRLVRGQLRALLLTLAVIFASASIGFRSLRLGLLALVPNVVPCVLLYGTLAWFGRPLSVASAMIGSVMLGLICDDTIHMLHRYREARAAGAGPPDAVRVGLHRAGRAIALTSLVLTGGFLAGLTGTLATTRSFAVLATAVIATAFLCNVVLTPALVLLPLRRPARGHRPHRLAVPAHHARWLPMAPLAVVALLLVVAQTSGFVAMPARRSPRDLPPLERMLVDWPEPAMRLPAGVELTSGAGDAAAGVVGRTPAHRPATVDEFAATIGPRGTLASLRAAAVATGDAPLALRVSGGRLGAPGRAPVRVVDGLLTLERDDGAPCRVSGEAGLAALPGGAVYVELTAPAGCRTTGPAGESLFFRGVLEPASAAGRSR